LGRSETASLADARMKPSIRFTPEAEQDLHGIRDWYSTEAPHVNPRFQTAFAKLLRRIRENPRLYPVVYRDLRRAVMHRFSFSIFYKVEQDVIHVLGVVHQSRDPDIWKSRA
jgi:toxin ParE1/3/4